MKWSIPAISLVFIGGVAVGIATSPIQPLRAAGGKAVFSVYEANVTDQEGYKNNFLKVVGPKLGQRGTEFLARGGAVKSLVGEPAKNRIIITQAKDMDEVIATYNDLKDDIKNIATKYADGIRWYAVEGVE